MSSWQLTKKRELVKTPIQHEYNKEKSVKVRITKSSISQKESLIYNNENPFTALPVVFGTSGVGIVSEDYEVNYQQVIKGTRVFVNSFSPCSQCQNCKNNKQDDCISPVRLGINTDGCMSDFAVVPKSNVFVLPKSVEDNDCLFLEYISMAISTLHKLNAEKGELVLIFGASILGNITAQIALYNQLVPVVIDDDSEAVRLASENGIYYALTNDDNLEKNLAQITSGMNVKNTIFTTNSNISFEQAIKFTEASGTIILTGFDCFKTNLEISKIWEKQITVKSVSFEYEDMQRAINLLAQKVINTQNLVERTISFDYVPDVLYKISTQVIKLTPYMKIIVTIEKDNSQT